MKTYAESVGKEPFNWLEELSTPVETWPQEKFRILSRLASKWPTCACGNMCDIIPRERDGSPIDKVLTDLGVTFLNNIQCMYINESDEYRKEAIETFHAIEARSAELIKELTK